MHAMTKSITAFALAVLIGTGCNTAKPPASVPLNDADAVEAFSREHHPDMTEDESSLLIRICVAMRTPRAPAVANLPRLSARMLDLYSEFAARTHRCSTVATTTI